MPYSFKHTLGDVVVDEKGKVELKVGNFPPLPKEKLPLVLAFFRDKKYFSELAKKNVQLTKEGIKSSVSADNLITQTIANIEELDKSANLLAKRLREWYGLYLPELGQQIDSHEKLASLVLEKKREELMAEFKIKETMGADLAAADLEEMKLLAQQVMELHQLRQKHEAYLLQVMKNYCPNLLHLAGVTIGAHLLELGKGLKNLALLPSSTIQLLGAEKALFRHLKTGSRSPKYGFIHAHQLIQGTSKKGKAARALADKLSLCARLDYFKGEFKAPEYLKELERKFSN